MEQQIPQQNITTLKGLTARQKDMIISAVVGLFCAAFILPIAQNLNIKQSLAVSLFLILPVLSAAGMFIAYWLAQKIKIFYQLAKFILVGALNSFVDWGIFNLLMFLTSIADGTMISFFKGISFLAATVNSYFWNKLWTFKKAEDLGGAAGTVGQSGKEMLQFFIVSLVGFTLNVGAATLIINVVGPQFGLSKPLWAQVGAMAGTVLGMVWNFLGYKLIVFKS